MKVYELRELLKAMPGEMCVYNMSGNGLASVKHVVELNLEPRRHESVLWNAFFSDPENLQDTLIERETGFKDRRGLISAYKELLAKTSNK